MPLVLSIVFCTAESILILLRQTLRDLGILYWRVEGGMEAPKLGRIRAERGYNNFDIIELHPDKLPNYEAKIKMFFEEHLHDDEEIRYILNGQGYFDCRDDQERWIRILVKQHDMIVLPAGMYHRFTLDQSNYIHVMRLFQDEPRWTAWPRNVDADAKPARGAFLGKRKSFEDASAAAPPKNGKAYVIPDGATALAHYPHMREVNGFLYVSGLSSRRTDNTHVGAVKQADGTFALDISEQTEGVLDNLSELLNAVGADLGNLVDVTVFLTDMAHFPAYNKVYNAYFDAQTGPTRTTVAVKQLPHPNLLIEIKAVAVAPSVKAANPVAFGVDV